VKIYPEIHYAPNENITLSLHRMKMGWTGDKPLLA
jgi:hypothetical protein